MRRSLAKKLKQRRDRWGAPDSDHSWWWVWAERCWCMRDDGADTTSTIQRRRDLGVVAIDLATSRSRRQLRSENVVVDLAASRSERLCCRSGDVEVEPATLRSRRRRRLSGDVEHHLLVGVGLRRRHGRRFKLGEEREEEDEERKVKTSRLKRMKRD